MSYPFSTAKLRIISHCGNVNPIILICRCPVLLCAAKLFALRKYGT